MTARIILNPIVSKLADLGAPMLLDFVVKGTLLLLAAWGVSWMLRRASAAVRHLVCGSPRLEAFCCCRCCL